MLNNLQQGLLLVDRQDIKKYKQEHESVIMDLGRKGLHFSGIKIRSNRAYSYEKSGEVIIF